MSTSRRSSRVRKNKKVSAEKRVRSILMSQADCVPRKKMRFPHVVNPEGNESSSKVKVGNSKLFARSSKKASSKDNVDAVNVKQEDVKHPYDLLAIEESHNSPLLKLHFFPKTCQKLVFLRKKE